jgi:TonB family protein
VAQPETAVEITYKPKPNYTPEAREKKIEGEVLLEVLFSASGRIEILRVLRGLGYGLDESARSAASQIRFQPGTRGGMPVDMKGTIHIVFAIS